MTIWYLLEKYIYGVTLSTFIVFLQRQIALRFLALNDAMRNHFLRYQEVEDRDKEKVLLSLASVFGDLESVTGRCRVVLDFSYWRSSVPIR